MHEYDIVSNKGHYDVYIDGELYCSADTYTEAVREINEHKNEALWLQTLQWDNACIECQRETNGVCRNSRCAKMHYDEQGKPIPADLCTIKEEKGK